MMNKVSKKLLSILVIAGMLMVTQVKGMADSYSRENVISKQLENCLVNDYGISIEATALITSKFSPLMHGSETQGVINDFMSRQGEKFRFSAK